jgi:hypothetical protein
VFEPADVFDPTDIFAGNIGWGDWVAIAQGTRVARYFRPGFVLITDKRRHQRDGTKFQWFVDVPDRTDDYTNLTVPTGRARRHVLSRRLHAAPAGGAVATPFNGGPNGSTVPHVQRSIVNATNGDEVKITNLTLAGCTVTVVNAGAAVNAPASICWSAATKGKPNG